MSQKDYLKFTREISCPVLVHPHLYKLYYQVVCVFECVVCGVCGKGGRGWGGVGANHTILKLLV